MRRRSGGDLGPSGSVEIRCESTREEIVGSLLAVNMKARTVVGRGERAYLVTPDQSNV